jgi:hypothetical protein
MDQGADDVCQSEIVGPSTCSIGLDYHCKRIVIDANEGLHKHHTKAIRHQNAHSAITSMDSNAKLDLAEDRGEKELEDIKEYQAIVESLIYAALATRPNISLAVATLCWYQTSQQWKPVRFPRGNCTAPTT